MVMDTGLPLNLIEDYLNMSASLIDYVKIGWGTSIVTDNIKDKIKLYQKYNIPISFGGTLFELAVIQNKVQDYKYFLKDNNIYYVEISNGSIDMGLDDITHR